MDLDLYLDPLLGIPLFCSDDVVQYFFLIADISFSYINYCLVPLIPNRFISQSVAFPYTSTRLASSYTAQNGDQRDKNRATPYGLDESQI